MSLPLRILHFFEQGSHAPAAVQRRYIFTGIGIFATMAYLSWASLAKDNGYKRRHQKFIESELSKNMAR